MNEIPDVKQLKGEPRRRWFVGGELELIVWFSDDNETVGFQLCHDESALSWFRDRGFVTARIDDGNRPFAPKMTPVLTSEPIDQHELIGLFRSEAPTLPADIADFVRNRLEVMTDDES